MGIKALWRTTTFRLTALYGLIFALGAVALLGIVYLQSTAYFSRRVDGILAAEADGLMSSAQDPDRRVAEAILLNGEKTNIFALFSPSGARLAGNLAAQPAGLRVDGPPLEIAPTASFAGPARLIARRLPSGEVLVVGRDVRQLRELRTIMGSALAWSGLSIILVGLACGTALSIQPMRRLQRLQDACQDIARGNLKRRMPTSARRDELDMFAATVNFMMDEVERLMSEVKGATETIAHDLRTPLTRARTQLHRLQESQTGAADDIGRIVGEIDGVLERFRALLRISELEARDRQAGFSRVDLGQIVGQIIELYQPLAEAEGVTLTGGSGPAAAIEADPKLLFEAVSNLVDNAIKFSGAGGLVQVRLGPDPAKPQIVVEDNGPGVPAAERTAVLQRFYRGERDRLIPGSGLGLSAVAAIVRLHRFELVLEDAGPGLRVIIACQAIRLKY